LDVVKTDMENYQHAGVYLGKIDGEFKVCHFTKDKNKTTIDNWSYFVGGEVIGWHPIIPFKHYKKIIKHIAGAVAVEYRKGDYSLTNRNCEHLANMLVYGIDYSEQIENKKNLIVNNNRSTNRELLGNVVIGVNMAVNSTLNNNKGSTIRLINEINETDRELSKGFEQSEAMENFSLTNQTSPGLLFASSILGEDLSVNLIKSSVKRRIRAIKERIEKIEAKVEIPPKQDCRVM
jgi:hypothetical protein